MGEPAKKERAKSGTGEAKSTMLSATVIWSAHVWNATAEMAAQQVVADLFDLLARGGRVQVRVEEVDDTVRMLEVAARR